MKGSAVPYLNCPDCRLTVYNPPAIVAPEKCPRCRAELGEAAPTLFPTERPPRQLDPESVMRLKAERRRQR
jgi:hypothetical protein